MRRFVILIGMVAGLGLWAGCQKPVPGMWDGVVGPDALSKASLQYYWRYKAPLPPGQTVQQLWRLDDNVYALTDAHRLVCLDAIRGTYKWSYVVADPATKVFAPCHADNVTVPETGGIAVVINPPDRSRLKPFNAVIINSLSYALVLNRDSGELVRRLEFQFAANTSGCSDGTYFYVGDVKGWIYAVRLSEGLVQWTMSTGDILTARPRSFNNRLYVGGQDGKFSCIMPNLEKDRRVWSQRTDGPLTADFVVDPRGAFVPSHDGKLYAYDPANGTDLWTFRAPGALRTAVQVGVRSAFQYVEGGKLFAVDIATGRERWNTNQSRVVLAGIDPNVLLLTPARDLLIVDEMLGKTETSVPMTGLDFFVPNAGKAVIYACTSDGRFVCIRPIGAPILTTEFLDDEAPLK